MKYSLRCVAIFHYKCGTIVTERSYVYFLNHSIINNLIMYKLFYFELFLIEGPQARHLLSLLTKTSVGDGVNSNSNTIT